MATSKVKNRTVILGVDKAMASMNNDPHAIFGYIPLPGNTLFHTAILLDESGNEIIDQIELNDNRGTLYLVRCSLKEQDTNATYRGSINLSLFDGNNVKLLKQRTFLSKTSSPDSLGRVFAQPFADDIPTKEPAKELAEAG